MNFLKTLLIVPLLLSSQIFAGHHEESKVSQKVMMNNIKTAKSWIDAGYTDKDSFMAVVKNICLMMAITIPEDLLALGLILILATTRW